MCRLPKSPGILNLLEPKEPLEACRGTALLYPSTVENNLVAIRNIHRRLSYRLTGVGFGKSGRRTHCPHFFVNIKVQKMPILI